MYNGFFYSPARNEISFSYSEARFFHKNPLTCSFAG